MNGEREFLTQLWKLYKVRADDDDQLRIVTGCGLQNRALFQMRANTYRKVSAEIRQWLETDPDHDFLAELVQSSAEVDAQLSGKPPSFHVEDKK